MVFFLSHLHFSSTGSFHNLRFNVILVLFQNLMGESSNFLRSFFVCLFCLVFTFFLLYCFPRYFIGYFIYLHFKCYPLSRSPLWKTPIPSALPCFYECSPPTDVPTPTYLPWHSPTLGYWAFTGPRAFPPIDVPQGCLLLHSIHFGWWFSPCELLRVLVVDIVVLPMGCKSFSSFSPFCNSFTGDSMLSSMIGCRHLLLYLSGSSRAFQKAAMSGSCQQACFSLCNSVWVLCLYMRWILRWSSLCMDVWMYHIFCIHSSVEWQLGFFQTLAIINKTALNIMEHVSLLYVGPFFQVYRSGIAKF